MKNPAVIQKIGSFVLFLALTACGGGGGGSDPAPTPTPTPTPEATSVSGGGVKGPLANAVVTVYTFDGSQAGFKGAVVATAATDANAAITGLALPFPVTPPYIMEFTSTVGATTDITTDMFPVITTLRTVITQSLLDGGQQIYATPLTTMAVDIAVTNAVDTNDTTGIQADEFETALTVGASQVISTLGFGLDSSVDIFDTPPLVDSTTTTAEQQAQVAAYRAAVEAVTAIAFIINEQSAGGDTDSVLAELAADLADGIIDGTVDGTASTVITTNTLQVFEQDPATLPIPNTTQTVGDVQAILVTEAAVTAPTTSVAELDPVTGSITTIPEPAETDPDSDGDGVLNVDDAFPDDVTETTDSDGDGIGDNADADDDNDGIPDTDEGLVPAPTADDTDGDGVLDAAPDNCINTINTQQLDFDGDNIGDACDVDDDNDGVIDTADAFPLDDTENVDTDGDGLGNDVADSDDDNDGVEDVSDTGEAPAGAPSVGIACSLLADCDGDGVFDGADFDPVDPLVTFNFAAVLADDATSADEDSLTFAIDVLANDSDDGVAGVMNITAIDGSDPAIGAAVNNGTSIGYTPAANASGVDIFTYTVNDGDVTATATVTVTINAVNDAPVISQASPIAVAMDEDSSPSGFVAPTIAAVDAEDDALTWSLTGAATAGVATVSGTGASPTITYVPNLNANVDIFGVDSFDVSVSDGNGGVSAITIEVTVNAQNDKPVVSAAGPFDINEDAINTFPVGSVIAADVDGPIIGYSITAGDAAGAFAISATGDITVADTNAIDYESDTSFTLTITATDGAISSEGVLITVDINDVNDTAPIVAAAGPFNIDEDAINTAAVGSVSATDADTVGSVTGYSITAGDAGGAFAISATGDITVADTTVIDFESSIVFNLTVTATDGTNASVGIPVVVDINDVNDTAPVVGVVAPFSIAEDVPNTTLVGSVSATDADTVGVVTNYNFSGGNIGGAFAISATGDITVANTALIDFETATSFNLTVTATDSVNTSVGVDVVVNITDVNDTAPVVDAAGPFYISEDIADAAFVGSVPAADADSVVTGYSITAGDAGGAFAISTDGQITVADTELVDFESASSFTLTITATDGTLTSAGVDVIVNISDVNDTAPVVAGGQSFNVIETASNGAVVGTVSASDADTVDGITDFSITGSVFAIDANGQITVIDEANLVSSGPTYNLTVDATDGVATSIGVTVTINVVNNAPPVIAQTGPILVSVAEDSNGFPLDVAAPTISATDAEGDSLNWSTTGALNGLAEVFGTGVNSPIISYTSAQDFSGIDSFDVDVTDGTSTVSITIEVTVTEVNDPPVATSDNDTTVEDTAFTTINVLTNDFDGGNVDGPSALSILSASLTSAEGGVVVNIGDGTFGYTPPENFNGLDDFFYTVTDGEDSVQGQVFIDVTPENDPPLAANDSETTTVNTAFTTLDVLSNDTDVENDILTVVAGNPTAAHGTVVNNNNGTFTYTPETDYVGTDSFTYTVSDSEFTDVGTVSITINGLGTPIAMSDLLSPANGGVVGLDSYDAGNGVTEYEYWTDTLNAISGDFEFADAEFNHVTGVFDVFSESLSNDTILSGGVWVPVASIIVTNLNSGAGGLSMDVSVQDALGTELESIRISAQAVDISGDRLDSHLNTEWQSAMFDADLQFPAGAKLITHYQFEGMIDAYFLYTDDWCETNDPARFTTLNGDCNAINSIIDSTGYATTLDQAISVAAWVDDDLGSTPPEAIFAAYNDATGASLMVDLVAGGIANYYVVDWSNADPAQVVSVPTVGTWVRDNSVQGVDMIQFVIPGSLVPLFADDLDEGLNNLLVVRDGFVRKGDFNVAGDVSLENALPLINGIAFDQVLANFSGDNYTQALEGTTIYDIYFDMDFGGPFLIDVIEFAAGGIFSTYDYQTGIASTESGAWDVSATGVLHLVLTSGPDTGDEWWVKVTGVNPDDGVKSVCASNASTGPFNCTLLDPLWGVQHTDELTAVAVMDGLNGVDPQIPVLLTGADGAKSVITGTWGAPFVAGDLTTGSHTLDLGGDSVELIFNIDGATGTIKFPPSIDNGFNPNDENVISWTIDVNGVLRFTETDGNGDQWFWVVGYFDTVTSGNVLVQITTPVGQPDPSDYFAMAGFDQTLTVFDAATLAGTTQYNVAYCSDGDAGCTIGDWNLVTMAFNADGSTLDVTYGGNTYPGTYSVTNGVLAATFDGGTDYIRILSVDPVTGAIRTCWEGSMEQTNFCTGNGSEFMFDDLVAAETFQADMTFTDAGADASTLLSGNGIYEFWDDEWDGAQHVPGYWNISQNGATVVDQEGIWSVMLEEYVLNAGADTEIALTSTGWQEYQDVADEIVASSNTATLKIFESGTSTVLDQWSLSLEVMDIASREQSLYVPFVGDQSAVFSAGAKWIRTTFNHDVATTTLGHWNDCGEPSYTDWGNNCNVVWLRGIDGNDEVALPLIPTELLTEFIGVTTETVELGWDAGNGNLLGVFIGDMSGGVINLYATNFSGPATAVGQGNYTIVNDPSGVDIVEYTLPSGFENTYNLFNDTGDTGILSVYGGFLRHGEREAANITGSFMMLNDVAANDVILNGPLFTSTPSAPPLDCFYESGWDDINGVPATFNSLTDFESVVTDCGGIFPIVDADMIGTWSEDGTAEGAIFNADGTGNYIDSTSGSAVIIGNFDWVIDVSNAVIITGLDFTDIWALTPSGMKFYTEEASWGSDLIPDGIADGEIWIGNYVKEGSALTCGYESGWDDTADFGLGAPINPNSFDDYETVLNTCGTAAFIASTADVLGVYQDGLESTTFNDAGGTGTSALDPKTGVWTDGVAETVNFEWYIEPATCLGCAHSYVVVYSDNTIEANLPVDFWFRETSALIGVTGTPGVSGSVYSYVKYSEQSNYSDTDRAIASDGEIWNSLNNVLQ